MYNILNFIRRKDTCSMKNNLLKVIALICCVTICLGVFVSCGKKKQPEFAAACAKVVEGYFDELQKDVSWFCKKFDYRYAEEPWYNSKDAVERAFKFLRSDLHNK